MKSSIESRSTKTAETDVSVSTERRDAVARPAGLARLAGRAAAWLRAARVPAIALADRPALLVGAGLVSFTTLTLVAVLGFRTRTPVDSVEIDLRPQPTCHKLDSTSAKPSSDEPATLAEPLTRTVLETTPEPIAWEPRIPETTARQVEASRLDDEPAPPPVALNDWRDLEILRNPHRGESPMIGTWRRINQQLMLAAAMAAASPAFAEPPEEPGRDQVIDKKLDDLKEMIEKLTKSMTALQGEALSNNSRTSKLEGQVEDLKAKIAQMQKELDSIKSSRTSFSPPDLEAKLGRVRLVNTYYEPVTVIVNGKAYALAAGETRLSDAIAAGTFTYEVLGIQAQRTRGLAANETFTITVFPR